MRSSWINVDLGILKKNTEQIRKFLYPTTKLLATVKGGGYGHGAAETAKVFSKVGVDYFGVAFAEEGLELRNAGLEEPILIYGMTFDDSYNLLFDYNLMPNIFSLNQAIELNAQAKQRKTKLKAHISIDTGLHRLGLDYNQDTKSIIEEIFKLPWLEIEGIFSMFANSRVNLSTQEYDVSITEKQYDKFIQLCDSLEKDGIHIPIRHICDSAGTVLFPHMQLDMVRIGSSLYGAHITNLPIADLDIRPAMSVHSKLACIRHVDCGEPVGYNGSWIAPQPSTIGVVPFGSVDGISGFASGKGYVLLKGCKCTIIGEICMDQMIIDITHVKDPNIGDEIVIIGTQGDQTITAQQSAECVGLEDLEYLCRMCLRTPIYYLENEEL